MKFIIFGVSALFYALFITGLILIFWNSFLSLYGWFCLRKRLPKKINLKNKTVIQSLDTLIFSINGKEKKGKGFLIVSLLIFFFVFLFALFYYSLLFSLFIALLCAVLPTLFLLVRLKEQRDRGAKEGRAFVMALYREYRMENRSIYTALEKVSSNKDEYPVCSKQVYKLLLRLRSSGNVLYIKKSCQDFYYSIGSIWAKILSVCIASSCSGSDISDALLEIAEDLKRDGSAKEEKKRLNAESVRMAGFMVPALYIGSVILCRSYMGLSIASYLKNQFFTKIGFLLFILSFLLFVIDLLALRFVNNSEKEGIL